MHTTGNPVPPNSVKALIPFSTQISRRAEISPNLPLPPKFIKMGKPGGLGRRHCLEVSLSSHHTHSSTLRLSLWLAIIWKKSADRPRNIEESRGPRTQMLQPEKVQMGACFQTPPWTHPDLQGTTDAHLGGVSFNQRLAWCSCTSEARLRK